MKYSKLYCCIFLVFTIFTFSECKKNDKTPAEQLPPQTQTGANTFGCLVNGQVFKPGGASLSGGSLSSNYQFLGAGPEDFHFRLAAINRNNSSGVSHSVGLFTDSIRIIEGIEYPLKKAGSNGGYAIYGFATSNPIFFDDYATTDLVSGLIKIKKFDSVNQIISGTFWFNAMNENGDTIKITDGRFDVRYTR
jgi:hypothetical protein